MKRTLSTGPSNLGKEVTIRTHRDKRRLLRRLGKELSRLAERAEQRYVTIANIQLVIQVCGERSYPSWRADRERTWRREGGRFSTQAWPATLRAGECGAVLLPLDPGPVASTAQGHPPLVASPRFAHGLSPNGNYQDAVLAVLVSWLSDPGFAVTARLAPPIVEVVFQRGVAARSVETFGLNWPLSPALVP
jgi:hypothetical protein